MIIKLIASKANPKKAVRYARDLARYMATADRRRLQPDAVGIDYGLTLSAYMARTAAEPMPPRERVLYRGAMVGGAPQAWEEGVAETERRLARRSRRVKKPVRHMVMSCQVGEGLSEEQCADAVAILARELGCEAATLLWAAHADTDNFHLHIMAVTVDPATGAALPFGQEADGRAGYKEAMQRALTRIEEARGLQAEAGARYAMLGEQPVRKPSPSEPPPSQAARKRAPLRQDVLDWEEASGFASFTRVAQDVAGPILDEASSWRQLHRALAPLGIGIRPAVNGGKLHAGDEQVKLSSVDRRHSWGKLEARLGPFEAADGVEIAPYMPPILDAAKAERWLDRSPQQRCLSEQVDRRVAALMAARGAALADSDARLSAHRADLAGFDGDPRLRQDLLVAWPRLRAAATVAIRSAFDARIAAVRALRQAATAVDDLGDVDIDALGEPDVGLIAPWRGDRGSPPITDLAGFGADRSGEVVRYWREGDPRRGRPALVDTGAIIWVGDRSDRAVEAALTLARERFGSVAAFGDAAYLNQCRRVGARLGIEVETISVAEARRRARKTRQAAASARQRALDARRSDRADTAARRLVWARAYRRAGLDLPDRNESAAIGESPHHSAIPAVAELHGSRAEPEVTESEIIAGARRSPMPSPEYRLER